MDFTKYRICTEFRHWTITSANCNRWPFRLCRLSRQSTIRKGPVNSQSPPFWDRFEMSIWRTRSCRCSSTFREETSLGTRSNQLPYCQLISCSKRHCGLLHSRTGRCHKLNTDGESSQRDEFQSLTLMDVPVSIKDDNLNIACFGLVKMILPGQDSRYHQYWRSRYDHWLLL